MENEEKQDEETHLEVILDPAVNDKTTEPFEFVVRISKAAAKKFLDWLISDIRSREHIPYLNPVYVRRCLQRRFHTALFRCAERKSG